MARGGVRINSGGVYKGVEAYTSGPKVEYVEKRNHSGKILMFFLFLVGILVAIMNNVGMF